MRFRSESATSWRVKASYGWGNEKKPAQNHSLKFTSHIAQCAHCKEEIPPGCQRREMAQISGLEYDKTYFFPGANSPEENTFLDVFLGLKL